MLEIIVGMGLIIIGVFALCLIGTVIGGLVGWVIQITPVISTWVYLGFEVLGINAQGHLVHIGATLGFIGSFFKSIFRNHED